MEKESEIENPRITPRGPSFLSECGVTDDYDSLWKEILDSYLPSFFAFFFPPVEAEIDWDRGYEFLNAELPKIVRNAA